jgi:hypothetical protein
MCSFVRDSQVGQVYLFATLENAALGPLSRKSEVTLSVTTSSHEKAGHA